MYKAFTRDDIVRIAGLDSVYKVDAMLSCGSASLDKQLARVSIKL